MENEKWLCVKNYENYEVSNFGRVRNRKGMILKTKIENGMCRVSLQQNGKTRSFLLKRLVLETFTNEIKNLKIINIDGDITNCKLENLKYVEEKPPVEYDRVESLPDEEWRVVKDYENYYVSNKGRVKSIHNKSKEKLLSLQYKRRTGYVTVILYNDKGGKDFRVHRLVALAFIPNDDPENKIEVNHKDENKTNNAVENLEWCTKKYNINYGSRNEKAAKTFCKRVKCKTTGKEFNSLNEAAKYYNISSPSNITCQIKGKFKWCGKLQDGTKLEWELIDDSEVTE